MWEAVEKEHGELSRRESFVTLTAMEWADNTMIEKACKWLVDNVSNYVDVYVSDYCIYDDKLVDDFRKAMEEKL